MRLIDADALLEEIVGITDGWRKPSKDWKWYEDSIRNAPTVDGWVSVKNRLPKDGQDVLIYLYNGEETRIVPCNYDKDTWYDCVMNCTVAINSITHWMPLPEPPKEVSE